MGMGWGDTMPSSRARERPPAPRGTWVLTLQGAAGTTCGVSFP